MKLPIRIGITGFGMSAKIMHIPFLLVDDRYRITAILERRGQEAAKLVPGVSIVTSIEELVGREDVDVVIVATPNDTHFPFAEKALLAGKHVIIEKPFTNTINEARVLIEIARRQNRMLTVYQNRRYVADFLTVKKIIDEKLLGDLIEYEARYDRYRPLLVPSSWKETGKLGSGTLYNLGSHLIDQALTLFGMPKQLYADVHRQRPGATADDYFDIQLLYASGMKATVKSSMLVREHGPRFVLNGTKGSFIKYGEDVQEAMLNEGKLPNIPDWGADPENQWGLLHTEKDGKEIREQYPSVQGGFHLFYNDLYETLINGKPLQVTPEQGYNTIRIIELALLSSKKKAVISIDNG